MNDEEINYKEKYEIPKTPSLPLGKTREKVIFINMHIENYNQGFQYTSFEYKAVCESNEIQISMSRKSAPIDDSPIESFHNILKKKLCIIIISHLLMNIYYLLRIG